MFNQGSVNYTWFLLCLWKYLLGLKHGIKNVVFDLCPDVLKSDIFILQYIETRGDANFFYNEINSSVPGLQSNNILILKELGMNKA